MESVWYFGSRVSFQYIKEVSQRDLIVVISPWWCVITHFCEVCWPAVKSFLEKKHFTFTIALSPASGINENRHSVKETCSILAPFCSGLAYHMGGMAINFRGVAKGGGVRCPWIPLWSEIIIFKGYTYSQASFLLSPKDSSPLYLSLCTIKFCSQPCSKDRRVQLESGDIYVIEIFTYQWLESFMAKCYTWLFTLKWTEEFSFIMCFVIKSLPFH